MTPGGFQLSNILSSAPEPFRKPCYACSTQLRYKGDGNAILVTVNSAQSRILVSGLVSIVYTSLVRSDLPADTVLRTNLSWTVSTEGSF